MTELAPLLDEDEYEDVGLVVAENGAPFFPPQIAPERHFRDFLNSIQQRAPPIFGGRSSRWA